MKKPIPLLINPTARSARNGRVRRWLAQHGEAFDVVTSESPGMMQELIREKVDQGARTVAVAGGDGTLTCAAKALLGTKTALAVVPTGTVNVFARELGIFDSSLTKAWQAIEKGRLRDVDVFLVNDVPFLQIGGVGIDARAIELTSMDLKKKIGGLAYFLAGIQTLFETQNHFTVTTNEGTTHEGITVIFGNGSLYGGPLKVFGKANHGDGLLDMVVFRKGTPEIVRDWLMSLLHRGFTDRMSDSIDYIQTTGCTIESKRPAKCQLDGDLLGDTPLTIARAPQPLKVCVLPELRTENPF